MKLATLITHNDLELPCVILPVEKQLFPTGKEVLVYCQNRLVRGYIEDDDSLIAELEVVVDFAMIPELDEFIKENLNQLKLSPKYIMYRVLLNYKVYPFDSYSEALKFKQENGGTIYQKVYGG